MVNLQSAAGDLEKRPSTTNQHIQTTHQDQQLKRGGMRDKRRQKCLEACVNFHRLTPWRRDQGFHKAESNNPQHKEEQIQHHEDSHITSYHITQPSRSRCGIINEYGIINELTHGLMLRFSPHKHEKKRHTTTYVSLHTHTATRINIWTHDDSPITSSQPNTDIRNPILLAEAVFLNNPKQLDKHHNLTIK